MPIVWRFLLSQYLKVLFFCAIAFIAVLLTTRLDDVAHFATLGAGGLYILLFTVHQIPYILPIAIPISGLISAIILMQRLSSTHEITALRSAGMSLRNILTPILIAGSLLTLLNFIVVSELATHSHLSTGLLKNELRSINPLLLLHNKHLMRLKGFYFESLGPSRIGESATDVIVAMPNKHENRLNLMVAKQLTSNSTEFSGKGVTIISGLNKSESVGFDPLLLENMAETRTSIADFSQMIQKKVWTVHDDYLRLPLLLSRIQEEERNLREGKDKLKENPENETLKNKVSQIKKNIHRSKSEIVRRISIAVATFTFTLMGLAFGLSISRHKSRKGVLVVICLAAFYLVSFFAAKAMAHQFIVSSALYLAPHLIIIFLSILVLRRVSKGIE